MTDREALAAALEVPMYCQPSDLDKEWWAARGLERAAVRERLAQLPEKCGTCGGTGSRLEGRMDQKTFGSTSSAIQACPTCHGSGKVYPAELVERIAEALHQVTLGNINASFKESRYPLIAAAVLDALNETP